MATKRRMLKSSGLTPTHHHGEATAHRGYLITSTMHGHHVSKDGYHITTQPSHEHAKREIDKLSD